MQERLKAVYMAFYAFGGAASRFGFGCLALAWLCWVPNLVVAEWRLVRGVFQMRKVPS